MDTSEVNAVVNEVVANILDLAKTTIFPAIIGDRHDSVQKAASLDAIEAGTHEDLRVPRMLMHSGKGDPGYETYRNVTLFDHVTSVAKLACTFAAVDLTADGTLPPEEVAKASAVAFATGICHDFDKLRDAPNQTIAGLITTYFERYRVADFLEACGISLTAAQMCLIVSQVEDRTMHSVPRDDTRKIYIEVARRYVKLADNLESNWLKDLPAAAAPNVVRLWNETIAQKLCFKSDAFDRIRALVVTDPHHPMIMEAFSTNLAVECAAETGLPPVIQMLCDETLVSFLPEANYTNIVVEAATQTADIGEYFELGFMVSPAGVPKLTGEKPSGFSQVISTVRDQLEKNDASVRRLLSVKTKDMENPDTADEITKLLALLQIPCVDISKAPGKTVALPRALDPDAPGFEAAVLACAVSFAVGVEGDTKSKDLTAKAREAAAFDTLGQTSEPIRAIEDALTRRAMLALAFAARAGQDKEWKATVFGKDGLFAGWFSPADGIFANRKGVIEAYREAIFGRLMTLVNGHPVRTESTGYQCFVTGEPVLEASIGQSDMLYGVKTSAFSNRSGTPENKFREEAATRLSPVSYCELRIRTKRAGGRRGDGAIPLKVSSPMSAGIASLSPVTSAVGDYSIIDLARKDKTKQTYAAAAVFEERCYVGRYESPRSGFGDRVSGAHTDFGRISFLRLAMEATLRYGRAIHIFAGLPHPRREFFYYDGMDQELITLLGGNGFRLEQLPRAIKLLDLAGSIAAARGAGGLGIPDLARGFALPRSRFGAACLAWDIAKKIEEVMIERKFSTFIEKETTDMPEEQYSAPYRLGLMAAAVQRQPLPKDGDNFAGTMFRLAVENLAPRVRIKENRESQIGMVAQMIFDFAERRSTNFFSAATRRAEGQSLREAVDAWATSFVDYYWRGDLKQRAPSSTRLRQDLAQYKYAFTHQGGTAKSQKSEPNQDNAVDLPSAAA